MKLFEGYEARGDGSACHLAAFERCGRACRETRAAYVLASRGRHSPWLVDFANHQAGTRAAFLDELGEATARLASWRPRLVAAGDAFHEPDTSSLPPPREDEALALEMLVRVDDAAYRTYVAVCTWLPDASPAIRAMLALHREGIGQALRRLRDEAIHPPVRR